MSLLSSGAASSAKGRTSRLDSIRAGGTARSSWAAGRSTRAMPSTRLSARVAWASVPGRRRTVPLTSSRRLASVPNDLEALSTSWARSSSLDPSSRVTRFSDRISRRSSVVRLAVSVDTSARSRWVGSKRLSTARRSLPRPLSPSPAPWSKSLMYWRVSVSSADRNSSGFTSGSVLEIGSLKSSSASGASGEPGFSSMNMSLSAVRGRSRAVASRRTMPSYSASIESLMMALPSCSSTSSTSPTSTPATRTVCP